jgi:hypothetical protein
VSRHRRAQCGSIVAHDSSSAAGNTTSVSTVSGAAPAAAPEQQQKQQQQAGADGLSEQYVQEVKGLQQLVSQQQALIGSLQRDVHALKGALLGQPDNTNSSDSSDSSVISSSSSSDSMTVPVLPQQLRQPVQQQPPSGQLAGPPPAVKSGQGGYQPMALEVFQSLPDKIILVRHAESLGNVDATTYSSTPDYEVRSHGLCMKRVHAAGVYGVYGPSSTACGQTAVARLLGAAGCTHMGDGAGEGACHAGAPHACGWLQGGGARAGMFGQAAVT